MSVIIKGMEMPSEGEYHMTLYVCSDGSAYIDVASFPVDEDRFKAVPIPNHGRLIDADALKIEVFAHDKLMKDGWNNMDMGMFTGNLMEVIAGAPTIIPAEEEGK